MSLLSHPLRVLPNGSFATAEDGTEQYMTERIGLILTTRSGERVEVPDFGIGDLEYEGLAQAALENQVEQFGLPVNIESVTERVMSDSTIGYEVSYSIDELGGAEMDGETDD